MIITFLNQYYVLLGVVHVNAFSETNRPPIWLDSVCFNYK